LIPASLSTRVLAAERSPDSFPHGSPVRTAAQERPVVWGLALVFLALHLPFLPTDPGGIDSANFTLGVRDFNVANHQPHPPGYPVFIAMGRLSNLVLTTFLPQQGSEARALAVWSAIAGALTAFPLLTFFKHLELNTRVAAAALAVTMTCPLFWFSGVRAMSDIPGLAAALVPQALLLVVLRRQRPSSPRAFPSAWWPPGSPLVVTSAAIAGVALGLRSQTAWLTLPLLILAVVRSKRPRGTRLGALGAIAFTAGVLVWAVPLLLANGGLSGYLETLERQGAEDLAEVDLLVTHPTFGRLFLSLQRTLGFPWGDRFLGVPVITMAAIGVGAMALRSRAALTLLAVAVVPYFIFHLLFQDSMLTRYALPIVPAVAYLAMRGVDTCSPRATVPVAVCLSVAGLWIAAPPVITFARVGNPAHQALKAVEERLAREPGVRPVLASHQAVALALRAGALPSPALPSPRNREWLEIEKYWREGGQSPVWFLAEPKLTDLAILDPQSWRQLGAFRWTLGHHTLVSGIKPEEVTWYELQPPGWFVGEGWSLSVGWQGATTAAGLGPGKHPIRAYVRRRPDRAVLMLGGRNIGSRGEHDARIEVTLDGRPLDSWTVPPENRPFLVMRELPAGLLAGSGYSVLEVRAHPAESGSDRPSKIVVEQFDLQSADAPVVGFATDWYEREFDPGGSDVWRWMGSRGTLRAHHGGRDLTLHVRASVPVEHLTAPPNIVVMAGTRELGRVEPAGQIAFDVPVPAHALDESGGVITLETDRTFVPSEQLGDTSSDPRALGLRVFEMRLR
jgi:hypothetical protein